MKHHPDLFDAKMLKNDTRLLFMLKLMLGSVCAYGGEIPLTRKELAQRMGTSKYRMNVLLTKLVEEGLVSETESGALFLLKYKFIIDSTESTEDKRYAKCFNFFLCNEFKKEPRNLQRFVLHYVGKELVYLPGNYRWGRVQDLINEEELGVARCKKEAERLLDRAEKYLVMRRSKESFQITGVKEEWLTMGETFSEGAVLWVRQKLKQHQFCIDFVTDDAIQQLAKVIEHYVIVHGHEIASLLLQATLNHLRSEDTLAQNFDRLIYEPIEDRNEISAYFRAIMKDAELKLAIDTTNQIRELEKAKQDPVNTDPNMTSDTLVNLSAVRVHKMIKSKKEILLMLHRAWVSQFSKDPSWFLKHEYDIVKLGRSFWDIQRKIADQFRFSRSG